MVFVASWYNSNERLKLESTSRMTNVEAVPLPPSMNKEAMMNEDDDASMLFEDEFKSLASIKN